MKLPPVPYHAPMFDLRGGFHLTPVWADWFKQAFVRMGGHVASTNDELDAKFPVATANIADDAVTADKLRDDASTDANRAVTTNHIRDLAITTGKIAADAVSFVKLLSTDWTRSHATSGYQKLPSGLYVQWGVTASLGSATTTAITFPVAFPTACFQVVSGVRDNSAVATTSTGQWGTGGYSTTGFSLYNRTSVALTFNWLAVGH